MDICSNNSIDKMEMCSSKRSDEMDVCSSELFDEMEVSSSKNNNVRQILDSRYPSPVSILEPSFWSESCNSSDGTDVSIMEGTSSMLLSLKNPHFCTEHPHLVLLQPIFAENMLTSFDYFK